MNLCLWYQLHYDANLEKNMARLNTHTPRRAEWYEAVERAHPPTSDAIIRELCERIEHGGKRKARATRGRRSVSEEDAKALFPSKKEDFDIEKVKKVLSNMYYQMVYYCVDHCELFGATTPEAFCKARFCVHKSVMKTLAHMLHNEIHFQLIKEKSKVRKRRIEIDFD